MTLAQLVGALNEPEILHEHTALARAARLVLRSLNDDQRDVLSALVHVGGPHADLASLAEVSGLPGNTVEAALTLLSQLRMIKAGTDRYAVGTASLRQILARLLPRSAERRRAAIFFAAAAAAHPGDLAWLERELGNLFAALKTALEQGMAPQVAALAQAVQPLLVLRGRWGGWGQVIDWARQAAQSSGDRALLAWALHEHGTRAGLLGDRASAAVNLTQARQLRLDLGDHGGATASQHNLEYLGLLPQSLDMNGRHKGGFLSKPWVVVVTLLALLFLSGGIVIAREIIAASEVTSSSIPTLPASIGTTSTPAPTRTSAQGSLAPTREASSGPVPSGATRPIARGDFQASGPTFSVSGPYMGGFLSEDSCAFYTAHGWNGDYYPPYMLWRSDQQSQFSVSADLRITDYAGPGTYKKERIDGAIALYINPGRVPVGYIGDDLTIIVNQDGSGKLTFSGTGSHSPGMVRGSMTWDCKDEMLDQEYFLEPFN